MAYSTMIVNKARGKKGSRGRVRVRGRGRRNPTEDIRYVDPWRGREGVFVRVSGVRSKNNVDRILGYHAQNHHPVGRKTPRSTWYIIVHPNEYGKILHIQAVRRIASTNDGGKSWTTHHHAMPGMPTFDPKGWTTTMPTTRNTGRGRKKTRNSSATRWAIYGMARQSVARFPTARNITRVKPGLYELDVDSDTDLVFWAGELKLSGTLCNLREKRCYIVNDGREGYEERTLAHVQKTRNQHGHFDHVQVKRGTAFVSRNSGRPKYVLVVDAEDGDSWSAPFGAFLRDNKDSPDIAEMKALRVGQTIGIGGGAAPRFEITGLEKKPKATRNPAEYKWRRKSGSATGVSILVRPPSAEPRSFGAGSAPSRRWAWRVDIDGSTAFGPHHAASEKEAIEDAKDWIKWHRSAEGGAKSRNPKRKPAKKKAKKPRRNAPKKKAAKKRPAPKKKTPKPRRRVTTTTTVTKRVVLERNKAALRNFYNLREDLD